MQGSFASRTYNFNTLLGRSSFPDYSAKVVLVPRFQRGYSWEKSHVSSFWEDLIAFHSNLQHANATETYFLGPIVILPQAKGVILLDGQQRLATVTILLSIIRDIARQKGGQLGSDLARDIQRDLIQIDDEKAEYALQLSELDKDYFFETIQHDPPSPSQKPKIRSNRLIKQAKEFLLKEVDTKYGQLPTKDMIIELKALKKTIAEKVKLVTIEVASEDEAYLIFETLNDRGLRLSVPDLLLNHLMRVANDNTERERVRANWNEMLEMIGQGQISTFLRHMWVSKFGDVKKQALFKEIREYIDKNHIESADFAESCAKECVQYIAIINCDKAVLGEACDDIQTLLKDLATEKALPLLLSGLCCLESKDYNKLVHTTLSLVVRHAYLANMNPATLEDTLYAAARIIRNSHENGETSGQCLNAIKKELKKITPTLSQITSGIEDLILTEKASKYVLKEIAKNMQSKTRAIGFDRVSLEHIFPKKAAKTDWPNIDELEPLVWHLGNLTFLEPKLNRDVDGKPFVEKQKYYKKSEIVMAKELSDNFSQWDKNTITERAKSLLSSIDKLWPI